MTTTKKSTPEYNTAVFWDIENLVKGYSVSAKIVKGLSLKAIMGDILRLEMVNRVAINRAYANWLNPKLAFLHEDLQGLDIAPVSVMGHLTGSIKNLADIQLTTEVMEVLYTRPEIQRYVIISGDGGYASLVHKLHEHGKLVIGCAYARATNRLLERTCDMFIALKDPDAEDDRIRITAPQEEVIQAVMNRTDESENTNLGWSNIYEMLGRYVKTKEGVVALEHGANPSKIKEYLTKSIPNFDHTQLGFEKFVDFLVHAVEETDLAVFFKPPAELLVGLRERKFDGFIKLNKASSKKFTGYVEIPVSDTDIRRLLDCIAPITTQASPLVVINKVREVIGWIEEDKEFRRRLRNDGLNPSTVDIAVKSIIPGFTSGKLGITKKLDFLLWLTANSKLCVMQSDADSSVLRVALRRYPLAGHSIVRPDEPITVPLVPQDAIEESAPTEGTEEGSKKGGGFLSNFFKREKA